MVGGIMKKICVIGHEKAVSATPATKEYAQIVSQWIIDNNFQATTGGCTGIPELVSSFVSKNGGNVKAYSPAFDLEEHKEVYGFREMENVEMQYLSRSNSSLGARFLIRSINLVEEADLVVCFNGTWGTLSEIVFAIMCAKQILFLNIEGANNTLKKVYDLMEAINLKPWHQTLVEVTSKQQLKEELEKFKQTGKI